MKLLLIPTCQRIVTALVEGRPRPRLCGEPSVAVFRRDDGQEHFVCAAHQTADRATGAWHLHRMPAPIHEPKPKPTSGARRPMSAEARARISAAQRARWARFRSNPSSAKEI